MNEVPFCPQIWGLSFASLRGNTGARPMWGLPGKGKHNHPTDPGPVGPVQVSCSGKKFVLFCFPLARTPIQKPHSPLTRGHLSPFKTKRQSSGQCFTVVLWELPSWLKLMPEFFHRASYQQDGEILGEWCNRTVPDCLVFQFPWPQALCLCLSACLATTWPWLWKV